MMALGYIANRTASQHSLDLLAQAADESFWDLPLPELAEEPSQGSPFPVGPRPVSY